MTNPTQFGPTGNYPNGQLNERDEGELTFGVAADPDSQIVVVNFGTPVQSIGLPPENAVNFGIALIKAAQKLQPLIIEIPLGGVGNEGSDRP